MSTLDVIEFGGYALASFALGYSISAIQLAAKRFFESV